MKRFLLCFSLVLIAVSFSTVFATDVFDTPAGLEDEDGDGVVYIDEYSQYQALLNSMDDQNDLKKLYIEQISGDISEYTAAKRSRVYRAKVLEASEPQVEYGQYPYYDEYYYKTTYQILKIKILDEPYKGVEVEDVNYILTCDSYENVKMSEVKSGTIINVAVYEGESGEVYAETASYDVAVRRWPVVLIFLIIALILIIVFTGEHFAKMIVPFILIFDLAFLTIAPMILDGTSIWWLSAILIFLSVLAISLLKFKFSEKTASLLASAVIVTILMAIIVYVFDAFAYMNGITYEATYIMEYVLPEIVNGNVISKVDFHALSVATTVLLCVFSSIVVICKTIESYEKAKKSKNCIKDTFDGVKENLSDNMLLMGSILMITMLPKYLLLLVNKCSFVEIINSEVMITDISRILFIVISMAISVPITYFINKFLSDEE